MCVMKAKAIVLFASIVFFVSFADAMMSYLSPIFIESQVNNTFLMGIIFSFSSVIGIICDLIFPKIFTKKPHYFFLKATLLSAVMFPLIYLLFPSHVITLLLAMAVWGIFYELNVFSSFHFVHTYVHISEHTKTWGFLLAFQSLAYAIAPILVIKIFSQGFDFNFLVVCIFLTIAVLLSLFFKRNYIPKKKHTEENNAVIQKKSWIDEFQIWKLLFPKVWQLLILQIALSIIDASFWTIGTLFTQKLAQESSWGFLFISFYIAPSILIGILLSRRTQSSGKKRIAIISTLISGLFLFAFYMINSVPLLLIATAVSSLFIGIAIPELKATFEDYVSRLRNNDNEMIGLQGSATSFAYIIGPLMATFIATLVGFKNAFALLGLGLVIISIFLLFFTPKKIRMPQKELAKI